jgi:hypothetical protein
VPFNSTSVHFSDERVLGLRRRRLYRNLYPMKAFELDFPSFEELWNCFIFKTCVGRPTGRGRFGVSISSFLTAVGAVWILAGCRNNRSCHPISHTKAVATAPDKPFYMLRVILGHKEASVRHSRAGMRVLPDFKIWRRSQAGIQSNCSDGRYIPPIKVRRS